MSIHRERGFKGFKLIVQLNFHLLFKGKFITSPCKKIFPFMPANITQVCFGPSLVTSTPCFRRRNLTKFSWSFYMVFPWRKALPFIWTKLNSFQYVQNWFVPSWFETGRVALGKKRQQIDGQTFKHSEKKPMFYRPLR